MKMGLVTAALLGSPYYHRLLTRHTRIRTRACSAWLARRSDLPTELYLMPNASRPVRQVWRQEFNKNKADLKQLQILKTPEVPGVAKQEYDYEENFIIQVRLRCHSTHGNPFLPWPFPWEMPRLWITKFLLLLPTFVKIWILNHYKTKFYRSRLARQAW